MAKECLPDTMPPVQPIPEYKGTQFVKLSRRVEGIEQPVREAATIHAKISIGKGREVNLGVALTPEETRVIHDLLKEYQDVFA